MITEIKAIGILFSTCPVHHFFVDQHLISSNFGFISDAQYVCRNLTFPLDQQTFVQEGTLAAQWRLYCNAICRSERRLKKKKADVL